MGDIYSLPSITVEIAFNPYSLKSLFQTWTDVSVYFQGGSTHGGRQHYLDRIESSTVSFEFDNRDGFFFRHSPPLRARLPIRLSANGQILFWGIIDQVTPHYTDALNSTISVDATDRQKFLSLFRTFNQTLYQNYVNGTSATHYYPIDNNSLAGVFKDTIGGTDITYSGQVSFAQQGVCLYDVSPSADFVENANGATATIFLNQTRTAIDFWINGTEIEGQTLLEALVGGLTIGTLYVNNSGQIQYDLYAGTTNSIVGPYVADGKWHHVGLITQTSNHVVLVVDGVPITGSFNGDSADISYLGVAISSGVYYSGQIDQITVSNATSVSTTTTEMVNRWKVGSLLRNDQLSGDRIADILVVAGLGSIINGVSVPLDYYLNDLAYVAGASGNGCSYVQGLTGSITTNTALDLITTVSDTEIGAFFQNGDGTWAFHTRAYPYVVNNNVVALLADNDATYNNIDVNSLSITYDDVDVWSRVIVTRSGGIEQIYESSSQNLYFSTTLDKSTIQTTDVDALNMAHWLGYLYQSPLTRVGNVQLRSETRNGLSVSAMLSLNYQSIVQFQFQPVHAPVINTQLMVESINHTLNIDGTWHTDVVLDPYPLRNSLENKPVMQLDGSVILDGNSVLL